MLPARVFPRTPPAGSIPAIVLARAPFVDGVVFPESRLTIYGTGDLFETLPTGAASRRRPKTASFFSDFSELKHGDYVVHVDPASASLKDCIKSKTVARAASSCA